MAKKQSLLKKFDIPINHLDYSYIDECNNPKEMVKILVILRSGQEGYFPDLTRHAEERLKLLKPNSKILRTETPLLTKRALNSEEWKELNDPIVEWIGDARKKDRLLANVGEKGADQTTNIPPIREKCGKIQPGVSKTKANSKPVAQRIKSTEYDKWDKFDADTEVLKMDLDEERAKEEIERKNNLRSSTEVSSSSIENLELSNLTEVERESLSLKYKERGNDFFRAKEYKEAIREYTNCISLLPSINGYNNRALVYLKLNDYGKCIEDSDHCLRFDPKNIKALLRKGEALIGLGQCENAYNLFKTVLSIDPENVTAKNHVEKIQREPPVSGTRMPIIEEESDSTAVVKIEEKPIEPATSQQSNKNIHQKESSNQSKMKLMDSKYTKNDHRVVQKQCEDDLSKLIIPKNIVKSKLKTAVEAIGKMQMKKELRNVQTKSKPPLDPKIIQETQNKSKCDLIQEL